MYRTVLEALIATYIQTLQLLNIFFDAHDIVQLELSHNRFHRDA